MDKSKLIENRDHSSFKLISSEHSTRPHYRIGLNLSPTAKAYLSANESKSELEDAPLTGPIDLKEKQGVISAAIDQLNGWEPNSAAKFVLEWSQSSGVVINDKSEANKLLIMMNLLCQYMKKEWPGRRTPANVKCAFTELQDGIFDLIKVWLKTTICSCEQSSRCH